MAEKRKYTIGERIGYAVLEIRGAKRGAAGLDSPHLDRRVEAIREKARKRAKGGK
jgi:hypothetical protein